MQNAQRPLTILSAGAVLYGELQLRDAHQLVQELHTGSHGCVDEVLACGHGVLDPLAGIAAEDAQHALGCHTCTLVRRL